MHFGANAVAVRARADGFDANGVVAASADVVEKVSRAAVGGQQNVGRAVVINIRVRRAAGHKIPREAQGLAGFLKSLIAFIMEDERKLRVTHLWLDAIDVGLDVAV